MFRDRIGLRTCLSVQGSGFRIYVWFRVSGLGLVESTSPLLDPNCFSVSSPPACDAHSLALALTCLCSLRFPLSRLVDI